tara:strand:+ start:528 stop:1712 length:1185 start_codon:yes stop_codon:yes gene_type:complete
MSKLKYSSQNNFLNALGIDLNEIPFRTFNSIGIRNTKFIVNNTFKSVTTPEMTKKYDTKTINGKINFGETKSGFPLDLSIESSDLTQKELKDPSRMSSMLKNANFTIFSAIRAKKQYGEVIQQIMDQFFKMGSSKTLKTNPDTSFLDGRLSAASGTELFSPFTGSNELQQAFFYFPLNAGDGQLISGDRVNSASVNLKILAHYGDRKNNLDVFQGASPLFGDLRIEPRVFEVVRVKKDIGFPLVQRDINTPEGKYGNGTGQFWESYYGTGSVDVDTSVRTEFTISDVLKPGETLRIDISTLVQDAIDNRNSILRFVIRPKMATYRKNGCSSESTGNKTVANGGFGAGNHYFDFERGGDDVLTQPSLTLNITPSASSTGTRRATLSRLYRVQLTS